MQEEAITAPTDLGDAVETTKGTAMMGTVDALSGFRQTGLSNED